MHNFEYIGCFFEPAEFYRTVSHLRINPLPNEKKAPHVTFAYEPETVPQELFGQPITVTVTGYGNNGENEGLRVTLTGNNSRINEMIAAIPVPHITLAVSDTGQAVNTRYLEFSHVEPIRLTGQFNGHQREETEQE